jgi:serine O-acetyltransferase
VVDIVRDLKPIMFPGYFSYDTSAAAFPDHFAGYRLNDLFDRLKGQIEVALCFYDDPDACGRAEEIAGRFIEALPDIQSMLLKDVQAGFDGDPACGSKEIIIFSYPGFNAIFIYRIAHELYKRNVPFIPRIMTEYAHSRTGIDINPGAKIGEYFFIDHGTGVVIGETTEIGNNVKIYQGVTLGALSTRQGQLLSGVKRHPTICDNVTIYSNASILGGETVIGANSTIGGSAFVTESVPANTRVGVKAPELTFKGTVKAKPGEYVYDWVI